MPTNLSFRIVPPCEPVTKDLPNASVATQVSALVEEINCCDLSCAKTDTWNVFIDIRIRIQKNMFSCLLINLLKVSSIFLLSRSNNVCDPVAKSLTASLILLNSRFILYCPDTILFQSPTAMQDEFYYHFLKYTYPYFLNQHAIS